MTHDRFESVDFIPSLFEPVAEFSDLGSADAIAGILRGEGIQARVKAAGYTAGVASVFQVLVGPSQLHRARWVLQDADLTDAELSLLATGQLGEEPE